MNVGSTKPGFSSRIRHGFGLAFRSLVLVLILGVSGVASMAGMDKDMQKTSFLKISYVGIQDKPISTLLLLPVELTDPSAYVDEVGLLHEADQFGFVQIVVSSGTFAGLVRDAQAGLPASDPDAAEGPVIVSAFSHEDGVHQTWRIDDASATRIFDRLSTALSGEAVAAQAFSSWRFRTNL